MQVDKYTFPPTGATGRLATPSHKLQQTFKFRDYAPKAFKKLRGHFGIDEVNKRGNRTESPLPPSSLPTHPARSVSPTAPWLLLSISRRNTLA